MKVSGKLKVTWELDPAVYDRLRAVMAGLQEVGTTDDEFWTSVLRVVENPDQRIVPAVPMDSRKLLEKEFRAGYDTAMLEVQKLVAERAQEEHDYGFDEGYDTGLAEGVEKGIEDAVKDNERELAEVRGQSYKKGYEDGCCVGTVHEAEKHESNIELVVAVANEHRVPGNDPPLCANNRKFEKIASIFGRTTRGEMTEK